MKYFPFFATFLFLFVFQSCKADPAVQVGEESVPVEGARISADKIIKMIQKDQNVFFRKITITGDLDFTTIGDSYFETQNNTRTDVPVSISFSECIFEGKVTAFSVTDKIHNYVNFEKNVSFYACEFLSEVSFKGAAISGVTDFSNSNFYKEASFEGTLFQFTVNNFSKTTYKGIVRFQRSFFAGDATFLYSVFEQNVSFQNASFDRSAQFGAVKFYAGADFVNLYAGNGLFFGFAEIKGKLMMNGANLRHRIEFNNAIFESSAEFKRVSFAGHVDFRKVVVNNPLDFSDSFFMYGAPDIEGVSSDNLKYFETEKAKIVTPELMKIN